MNNKEKLNEPSTLLDAINSPADLRKLHLNELPDVCREVRDYLIDTVSQVGGHFASNLGVIELTVALHYSFHTPSDRIVWDVGHQVYPHKILTGRKAELHTVRKLNGISGFPKREESPYDTFNTGHAGTSISQMLGEAVARDRLGLSHRCVAVIGDASIGSGMAFEALNHGGHLKSDGIVILNDNDMSISRNVGALNQYLNHMITSPTYNKWRKWGLTLLLWLPVIGPFLQMGVHKLERSFKGLVTPGSLFSDFGFRYIGPVDGHNVMELVKVFKKVRDMKGPILIHVYTQKGKGFTPAEKNPIEYHSVNCFHRNNGESINVSDPSQISFSGIVGETLMEMVAKDKRILAITPAMIEGSGLRPLADHYPDHVIDVGIAEQHAASFAGALAAGGVKPYLCIYSTFMMRAIDQMIQDIALMYLPVRIIIDRAGCIGSDGETHQGLFDPGAILAIPNIQYFAPSDGAELKAILLYSQDHDTPLAIRFPKESASRASIYTEHLPDVSPDTFEIVGEGKNLAILSIGTMKHYALQVQKQLGYKYKIESSVIPLRWIRPLDMNHLEKILSRYDGFVFIEDAYHASGAGQYLKAQMTGATLSRYLYSFAFPEHFIEQGQREEIFNRYGMSPDTICETISSLPLFSRKVFTPIPATTEK